MGPSCRGGDSGSATSNRPRSPRLGDSAHEIRSRAARRDGRAGRNPGGRESGGRRIAGHRDPGSTTPTVRGGDQGGQRGCVQGSRARRALRCGRHERRSARRGGPRGHHRVIRMAEARDAPLPGAGKVRKGRSRRDRVSPARSGGLGPPSHTGLGAEGSPAPTRRDAQVRCRRPGRRGRIGHAGGGDPVHPGRIPLRGGAGAGVRLRSGCGGTRGGSGGALRGLRRRGRAAERRGTE